MTIYRVLLACGFASLTACSVPEYFLVDGAGGGSGSGSQMDAGADAMPDAEAGAATVTNVSSSTTDGFYKAAASVSIQVTFSQAVTVSTTGGTPRLALNSGADANYASGTGTTTLTFTYTVAAGESAADLDYVNTTSLALNGGTIKNGTVNSSLALPAPGATGSLGANKALVIDAVAPTISTITGPNTYAPSASATLAYTVTEANQATTTCTQTVGTGVMVSCNGTGATFTGLSEGAHTITVTHTDAAGNVSAAKTISWTVDTIAPTVSTVTGPAQYAQSASATLSYSVTETNQGTTNCTQTVGTGTVSACTTSGVSFTSLSEGAHTVTISHTDLAGTTSTVKTYSWTVDTINPSISTPSGPAAFEPSNAATIGYILTETNQGTMSCNLTSGTGAIGSCTTTRATLSGLNEGPHVLVITHTDLAGRTGTQTFSWTVDTIAPVISSITVPTNGWTASNMVSLTYTITEANPSTTSCNQDSGTGTETACTTTTASYTSLSIGGHDVTIKHTDKAGNSAAKSTSFAVCPPFTYPAAPSTYIFQTPSGCGSTMDIFAWGGGGSGGNPNVSGGTGGGGGFVAGTLTGVGGGYSVYVGGGGKNAVGGVNGGGDGGVGANERGGGGGGWSGVSQGGVFYAVAAGGGGGGGCVSTANGGGGGGPSGANGTGPAPAGGGGATLTAPGAGGGTGGQSGAGMTGGVGSAVGLCGGGGGGGGVFGGGGGGSTPPPAVASGGAGGGSSTVHSTLTNVQNQAAAGSAPGGRTIPQYQQGVGIGSPSGNLMPGGDGMVIIHVHP